MEMLAPKGSWDYRNLFIHISKFKDKKMFDDRVSSNEVSV